MMCLPSSNRVKDLVNREEAKSRLRALKHKRKYFPKKVGCCQPTVACICAGFHLMGGAQGKLPSPLNMPESLVIRSVCMQEKNVELHFFLSMNVSDLSRNILRQL